MLYITYICIIRKKLIEREFKGILDPALDPDPQPWVVVGFSNLWRGEVFLNVSYLSLPWFYGRSCDSTAAGGYLTRTWLLNKKVSHSGLRTTKCYRENWIHKCKQMP